jgi:aminopeptidase N
MTNYYLESKYGIDTLKKRMVKDRQTVLSFERRRMTPVVDTTAKNNLMVLLNANSYQKGGWVLHMLRRKLGEDAFWKGIRNYYAKYNGSNANTDDLRKIMEQASGQSLQVFFTQWLLTSGHPQLAINWTYDVDKKMINLFIEQKQNSLYDMPLDLSIAGQKHTVNVKDKTTTIQFAVATKPAAIVTDPDINILASFTVTNTEPPVK